MPYDRSSFARTAYAEGAEAIVTCYFASDFTSCFRLHTSYFVHGIIRYGTEIALRLGRHAMTCVQMAASIILFEAQRQQMKN